ncbi:hypothetical protein L1987_37952 [Smallanthus sonchifolius]|uniref:Uncharacterized protein n=1 Tax=Smallanthus sonchifolius TaxID=185202 RepID=A0ACB9HJ16_9ASTR|nr:hypothetical protein L1987_37952 [Smallanthus sonchifolius]
MRCCNDSFHLRIGSFHLRSVGLKQHKYSKAIRMPCEKEELLNAVVCRLDSLDAELIATKKDMHEALMRQEELLAYIDGEEEKKFWVS